VTAGSSSSQPPSPGGKKWLRRIALAIMGALGTISVGLVIAFFTTPVNEAGASTVPRLWGRVVGSDKSVELKVICQRQGDTIVSPPSETDAAFHYRCRRGKRNISEPQIAKRCMEQWGNDVRLVLRDRDSASGWKCHKRGWLRWLDRQP
jgi:hypothetical protein